MKEYIENVLHQNIRLLPYEEKNKLPLHYRGLFEFWLMFIQEQECLVAAPKENINLAHLRKYHKQLEIYTGRRCVLFLQNMNYYLRDTLLIEGIPFVWEGHQVYLPFLGVLLDSNQRKIVPVCTQISFLTQKLLLQAIYQNWKKITVTKAAVLLDVTKTSVTRCFDEMEALELPYLLKKGRSRELSCETDKVHMWETLQPFLRYPVLATVMLRKPVSEKLPLSGISALSHYSLLQNDSYPTLAVTKKNHSVLTLSDNELSPAGEIPGCVIQKLGYQIFFGNGIAVDPLTVALSLTEEQKSDPRIAKAVDDMLEEFVW